MSVGFDAAVTLSGLKSGEKGMKIVLVIVLFVGVVRRSPAGVRGKKDRENRSRERGMRPALDLNGSTVPAHDFRADPKPEAGSGISPRADERLEERVPDVGANARSVVSDCDANPGP